MNSLALICLLGWLAPQEVNIHGVARGHPARLRSKHSLPQGLSTACVWWIDPARDNGTNFYDLTPTPTDGRAANPPNYNAAAYYTFTGSTDRIIAAQAASIDWGSTNGAVALWFASSNVPSANQTLIVNGAGGAGQKRWQVYLGYVSPFNDGLVGFQIDDDTTLQSVSSDLNLCSGAWHHVVCQKKNGTLEIHIDGVLDNSLAVSGYGSLNDGEGLSLGVLNLSGGAAHTDWYKGNLGAVKCFNRFLSTNEVRDLFFYESNEPRYLSPAWNDTCDSVTGWWNNSSGLAVFEESPSGTLHWLDMISPPVEAQALAYRTWAPVSSYEVRLDWTLTQLPTSAQFDALGSGSDTDGFGSSADVGDTIVNEAGASFISNHSTLIRRDVFAILKAQDYASTTNLEVWTLKSAGSEKEFTRVYSGLDMALGARHVLTVRVDRVSFDAFQFDLMKDGVTLVTNAATGVNEHSPGANYLGFQGKGTLANPTEFSIHDITVTPKLLNLP